MIGNENKLVSEAIINQKRFCLNSSDKKYQFRTGICSKYIKSINCIFRGEEKAQTAQQELAKISGINLKNGEYCRKWHISFRGCTNS